MTFKLACHHGHWLEITTDLTDAELVCDRCGSVMNYRPSGDTRRSRSVGITLESNKAGGGGNGSSGQAGNGSGGLGANGPVDDAAASMFLTLDHAPPAGGHTSNPSAATNSRGLASGASASTGISSGAAAPEQLEPPRLPGLEVIEEIGRGGMGVVYRARDKAMGREVALKTLQRLNPDSLHRFKQEFRVLADIAHPNLASLYELLSDGQTWCFSMEILQGVDFLEYVWSGFETLEAGADATSLAASRLDQGRLTEERMQRLQDAMSQLASGLNALHAAGILHTDIKPSNVLVTTEGRLVLLDFGLAVPLDEKRGGSKLIQGTPRYMSPEQASAKPLTEASDWYSVGVMLYEVLTGRLPHQGNTMQILAKKQFELPIEPLRHQPDNPKHLNDLCVTLLDHEPAKRPRVEEIMRCFRDSDDAELMVLPQRTAALRSVDLVGRERHFGKLRESFAKVSAGDTLSMFVHGKSGMGKSVLVRGFLDGIEASEEAIVLEGRCYEQESVPFKALDSLIDSLAVHLATLPEDTVHGLMPRDRKALTRVFPVLGGIREAPHARYPTIESADQQELRQRAMNALRELLQRLAIREPLVLYIDDLQWGDADSAALLADLVRPPDAPQMLLLGSYRTEDAETSQCLRALTEAYQKGQNLPHREELAVESLTESESTQLALTLLGREDETSQDYARKIALESQGWPFFVWELAQHVQEDPEIADRSLELDEVIWVRVNRLPKDAIRLLELIAVAGRPMPIAEVYQALDVVAQGPSLLAQLRTSNFIRSTESAEAGTLVESYHDRIRESVFRHLDDRTAKGHNLSLALMTEQASGLKVEDIQAHIDLTSDYEEPGQPYSLDQPRWQRVFDAAYFFDAARESARAFPFALIAAEQAWSQNALDVAEQQFKIAQRGAESSHEAIRFRIAEGLGDVLLMRACYEQASQQFDLARSLAKDNATLARIDGKRGYLCFKKGDMANSARHFEQALAQLGDPPPSNFVTRTAALCKEVLAQLLHTYIPSWFVGRRKPESATYRRDMLRARLYDGLGYSYWFTKGPIPTLWTHLRHMNLAERYPPSQELGRAYAVHAVIITAVPLAARGVAYAEKSYQIHGDLGDRLGQGKARSFQTFSLLALGRFREGIESGREAVELLEQAGDVWEANMARIILSQPLYFLGDLQASHLEAKQAYEVGNETGDYSAMAIALDFWVPSAPHQVPEGALQAERERPREDPLSSAAAIQGRGLELLLRENRAEEAAKVIDESLVVAKRRGLRNPCIFGGVTWKATALRIVAERAPKGAARNAALRAAKQAARTALGITNRYRACRAQALRERALIAVLEGNEAQARRYFDDSLRVADEQEARYERAKSLQARAEAGLKFRWQDVEQQLAEARAVMEDIERFSADPSHANRAV